MSRKALSPELQDQLDRLATLPDDQIDTTDIPEMSAEAWQHARWPGLYHPLKKPVALRLDVDIVTWFKEHTRDLATIPRPIVCYTAMSPRATHDPDLWILRKGTLSQQPGRQKAINCRHLGRRLGSLGLCGFSGDTPFVA